MASSRALSYALLLLGVVALLDCGTDADTPGGGATPDAGSEPDSAPSSTDASVDAEVSTPFPCSPGEGTWTRCSQNPLYLAGKAAPGGNVELSVGDPDVLYDEDDHKWKAWWSTGVAPSFAEAEGAPIHIKYAESLDGIAWNVQAEPAFESGGDPENWDNSKVETPSVIRVPANPPDRRFVMFYAGGNDVDYPKGSLGFTWYQIGVAFSADGRKFTRLPAADSPYFGKPSGFRKVEGLLLHGKDAFPGVADVEEGGVADPEIVFDGTSFHLLFSSFATRADRTTFVAYGMSQGRSADGVHFTMASGNPRIVGGTQPSVIRVGNTFELYLVHDDPADSARVPTTFNPYLGIWKRTSSDLETWSARDATQDFVWNGAAASERYGMVKAGDMAYRDGIRRYYWVAFGSENVPSGFATLIHQDASVDRPDGAVDLGELGVLVPAVFGLHVAARR